MSKLTNKFRQLNIQISFYYSTIILFAIILIGLSSYYIFSNVLINQTTQMVETSIENSGRYMSAYIDKIYGLSNLMANDQKLHDYIKLKDERLKVAIEHDIYTVIESDDFIQSIIIVTHDGKIISNEEEITMEMSEDMMREHWYQYALHAMPYLSTTRMNQFTTNKDTWVISFSQEIVDENNHNLGVILMDIDYRFVNEHIIEMDAQQLSEIYILDSNHRLVYHKDTSYFTDLEKQATLLASLDNDEFYDKRNQQLRVEYRMTNADWILVSKTPLTGLRQLKREILLDLIVISLALIVLVLFISNRFSKKITKPVKHLEMAMLQHQRVDAVLDKKPQICYEVQNLTVQYNAMVDRINLLMAENTEKERRLRDSEIETLTSQINPHFLYNTLDTILWMAESQETEDVIDITKALGQFFRLSLSDGAMFVPLRNEIAHVKAYLFIQKKRYGNKLMYHFEVDESIQSMKVPKIILQPIVENAIYHGIREKDNGGHILIQSNHDETFVYLTVTDDGIGFDPSLKLSGLGLKNVDERLKRYFCDACGVLIESKPNQGTCVTLKIRGKQ